MKTCYQSEFLLIKFDNENKVLSSYWNTEAYMTDDEYRKEFESYIECVIQNTPKGILVNALNAKYVVPIATQEWINSNLNPLYEKYNTKKLAIIMSTDFIAQLSFEQVVDDLDSENLKTVFFDKEETAFAWLTNTEKSKNVA